MNVAILPSAFHPSLGGIEELVRQLAHALKARGVNPVLVTNRWPRDLPEYERFEGLDLYRLAFRVPTGSTKARLSYHLTHHRVRQQLVDIVRRHACELIHVQGVTCSALYAMDAAGRLDLPLMVTMQGELTMDARGIYQREGFAKDLHREALEAADFITGVSNKTLRDAEEAFGMTFGDRGRRIFNGARVEDYVGVEPHRHDRPYIFAGGRLVPQKGFDVLLRALAKAGLPELDLLIAGDGDEREPIRALIDELGLGERAHLVGRADRAQMAALFRGCAFFVIPSRADEGLPVISAEAMAAGCAIVGTISGGMPEAVVEGETGFLVEREDVDGLAEAMTKMAADPAMRERMAKAGAERADLFAWSRISGEYEAAYHEAKRRHAAKEGALQPV